ncbi:MAG TPA: ABC transporter substrate-binding protein [Hyphomicrobiaceae bacterium]|jgi:iron complex transport system substrate-binding protein|nr:ABC transporter substrate-binding protein [Hyphomicrobiaceae bacterium]
MILRCALALLALVLSPALAAAQQAKPQRIVSLNLCTDILLIDLVAPERIQALSVNATDPLISPVAERARRFKRVHADAEEVLALDPDLVVNAEFTSPATASLLQRIGRRVAEIPMAHDIEGVKKSIARMAEVTGEAAKGQAIVADFDVHLSRLVAGLPSTASRPTALIYQINGIASGTGLLEDQALQLAGFRNLAPALNPDAGGRVALEAIVANPPDLLALAGPSEEYRTVVADTLAHPAIAAAMKGRATIVLPWRDWICGSPYIVNAIETLAKTRRELAARRPPA